MTKRVMIIDQDEQSNKVVSGIFKGWGMHVIVQTDGVEALDLLQKNLDQPPDLILLCAELERMNGFYVCRKIKSHDRMRTIPLIISSATASDTTFLSHKKLRARADYYLHKPLKKEDLEDALTTLIKLDTVPADKGSAVGGDDFEKVDGEGEFQEEDAFSTFIEEKDNPEGNEISLMDDDFSIVEIRDDAGKVGSNGENSLEPGSEKYRETEPPVEDASETGFDLGDIGDLDSVKYAEAVIATDDRESFIEIDPEQEKPGADDEESYIALLGESVEDQDIDLEPVHDVVDIAGEDIDFHRKETTEQPFEPAPEFIDSDDLDIEMTQIEEKKTVKAGVNTEELDFGGIDLGEETLEATSDLDGFEDLDIELTQIEEKKSGMVADVDREEFAHEDMELNEETSETAGDLEDLDDPSHEISLIGSKADDEKESADRFLDGEFSSGGNGLFGEEIGASGGIDPIFIGDNEAGELEGIGEIGWGDEATSGADHDKALPAKGQNTDDLVVSDSSIPVGFQSTIETIETIEAIAKKLQGIQKLIDQVKSDLATLKMQLDERVQ